MSRWRLPRQATGTERITWSSLVVNRQHRCAGCFSWGGFQFSVPIAGRVCRLFAVGKCLQRVDNCIVVPATAGAAVRIRLRPHSAAALVAREEGAMAHTNRVRVLLGGLLAGLVINVVEFVTNGVVLRDAWGSSMQALGKPVQLSAGAIVVFNIWGFLLGIAAVWLYAAIRPRYDAGPKTAIRAGVFMWAVAVFLANLSNYPLGLFPTRLLVISSIVALLEIVLATLVGAWLYKEEAAATPVIHRAAA